MNKNDNSNNSNDNGNNNNDNDINIAFLILANNVFLHDALMYLNLFLFLLNVFHTERQIYYIFLPHILSLR